MRYIVVRVAVLSAPGRISLEDRPVPAVRAGEVLVRLDGCGVCGSNLPVYQGREWFTYPLPPGTPGHEGWGRVADTGPGVRGFSVGQPVCLLSEHAFAELDVAPAERVLPIPEPLVGRPFPGEPLACAMNVFRRSGVRAGETVAVVGIGFLGALLTQLAAAAGARVVAISRRPFAREVGRRCGAEEALPFEEPSQVAGRIMDLTHGKGCERVFECVGSQSALDVASELVAVRGRLIIAGYHQDGDCRVNLQSWNWRGLDVINAHERNPEVYILGLREAMDAVCEGRLDPFPLLTHSFPLEELGRAMETALARPDGFLKSWVAAA